MNVAEFVAKWRKVELKERSAAQEHFLDLCRVLGHPTPAEADPTGETFCFDRGAAKHGDDDGFADVWKAVFFNHEELKPVRTSEVMTEGATERLAGIAKSLRKRGLDPAAVAHLPTRLVFCLFAEDLGLLPGMNRPPLRAPPTPARCGPSILLRSAGPRRRVAGPAVAVWLAACALPGVASNVTFFSYSDIHYGADEGGKAPPKVRSEKVDVINALPGTPYPPAIGGTVGTPRGIIMQGDLINDGALAERYPAQWANYLADFGVHGEGRCRFPVFEGLGNHDLNANLFVFNQVRARNEIRRKLNLVGSVSSNGYHYSWDWDGVHFINVNLFPGNTWDGEADAYGRAHDPLFARDFLEEDLRRSVGDSGRPVVVVQHFRPIDENWWTYGAADRFHRAIQDYNVILILVGHQGGGVNNRWRGLNWVSSNGDLVVCRIDANRFVAVNRGASNWGQAFQKEIFPSFADSGLPAFVNNGAWASKIGPTGATLSAKVVYETVSPTEVTVFWGPTDGGTNPASWAHATNLGARAAGVASPVDVGGLQPWSTNFHRCRAVNAKGEAWAAYSVPFHSAGLLPAGWETAFVGFEQRPGGGAHVVDGVFTVRGSGRDIGERGERRDNFQFAWTRLDGDGEFRARIASAEARSREPKVGIMLRESAGTDARHVSVLLMPKSGVRLVSRKAVGGASSTTILGDVKAAPCWVKLVRKGTTFSGFVSADGSAWTPVGAPLTLDLPPTLLAGLAVTAGNRDESKLHTSTFDHAELTRGPEGP